MIKAGPNKAVSTLNKQDYNPLDYYICDIKCENKNTNVPPLTPVQNITPPTTLISLII